jgi:hypothetical protein
MEVVTVMTILTLILSTSISDDFIRHNIYFLIKAIPGFVLDFLCICMILNIRHN